MSALTTVLTGPPSSGKTELLLRQYRAVLRDDPAGAVLWLAPTWRAAAAVRDRLLDANLAGCFRPGIMTFANFAGEVLKASPDPIRPLTAGMKRQLVRQLIDEQNARGRLKHFQPIVRTGGLVDLVGEFLGELKRLEIWPEHFRQACQSRGISAKDEELLEIYETYQQALTEHRLFDAEGSFWSARNWLQQGQRRPFENVRFVVADGFSDFTRTQHEILQILAGRVESLSISLTLEPPPCREDLFAKPLKTLAELRSMHPELEVQRVDSGQWTVDSGEGSGIGIQDSGASTEFKVPSTQESVEIRKSQTQPSRYSLLRTQNPVHSTQYSVLGTRYSNSAPTAASFLRWPAMQHLARHLFGNPRQAQPAEATEGIEILAAARPIGEMELIGADQAVDRRRRRQAGRYRGGFPRPQDPGGLAAEVFDRLGLPTAWEQGVRLDRMPLLRALVALLNLDKDDWPFDSLLAVIGSNYFQPAWPAWRKGRAAIELERAIRRMQIPQGREALLNELRRTGFPPVAQAPEKQNEREDDETEFEHAANRSLEVLERLAAAFDELPQKATLPEWAKAWMKLARQTGMSRDLDWEAETEVANIPKSDTLAWKILLSVLSAGDRLSGWLRQHPPLLDREEALRSLVDILGSERLPPVAEESGRIRVLSASSVRSLHVPYLFLAGLSEKAFPQPDREDRLYSEAEYARLVEQNLPLVTRTERNREEMLLFYEAVTRASKRLYLSYPALDDSAQPLSPSPFLLEVEQACGKDRIAKTEAADFRPVPKTGQPLSPGEFRLAAMAEALEGNYRWLACLRGAVHGAKPRPAAGVKWEPLHDSHAHDTRGHGAEDFTPSAAQNLFAGLELTMLRQDRERFGPAEGILSGDKARKQLNAEFSPQRTFSATELESYARCPYRYLLEKILKIEPLEDLALESDYLERGQSVHEVLAAFHQKVNQLREKPTSPAEFDDAEFGQLMQAAMQECLPPSSGKTVREALREIDRRLIAKWLADYRRQHEEYDKLWLDCETPPTPEFFEISFGLTKHASKTWAKEEPLKMTVGEDTIRLSGRIDRVDAGKTAGHAIFNILDYKTGAAAKFSLDEFMHGAALQLPIYALAVMELFLLDRDAIPWQAGYWFVAKDGFNNRQALKMYDRGENGRVELVEEWENIRGQIREIAAGLVHGIRNGFFPVFNRNERCTSSCPFSTICRINQIRSLEKTCLPTVMSEGKQDA